MTDNEIKFEVNGNVYTAHRFESGKPGQWWRCDALDAYVGLPDGATEADAIAAFESLAAPPDAEQLP